MYLKKKYKLKNLKKFNQIKKSLIIINQYIHIFWLYFHLIFFPYEGIVYFKISYLLGALHL
jgi:hypothetical protein